VNYSHSAVFSTSNSVSIIFLFVLDKSRTLYLTEHFSNIFIFFLISLSLLFDDFKTIK
jgi:hypothetical protein